MKHLMNMRKGAQALGLASLTGLATGPVRAGFDAINIWSAFSSLSTRWAR